MYRCFVCKRVIPKLEGNKVICPYCGSRILIKERPKVVKRVRAR